MLATAYVSASLVALAAAAVVPHNTYDFVSLTLLHMPPA